jgi:hypothetical protein
MTETERLQKELEDKTVKLRSARKAAETPGASDRERADAKLMEQDFRAQKQTAQRGSHSGPSASTGSKRPSKLPDQLDRKLDSALAVC